MFTESATSTTRVLLVRKSVTLLMLSLMARTVSCCPERLRRARTPSRPVSGLEGYTRFLRAKRSSIVLMMAETCYLAEKAICYPPLFDELRNAQSRPTATVETVAMAAVAAASESDASAILVLSTSGNTARMISKYRPSCPIITGDCFFDIFHQ